MTRLSPSVSRHLGVHGAYSFLLPDLASDAIRELRDPDAPKSSAFPEIIKLHSAGSADGGQEENGLWAEDLCPRKHGDIRLRSDLRPAR